MGQISMRDGGSFGKPGESIRTRSLLEPPRNISQEHSGFEFPISSTEKGCISGKSNLTVGIIVAVTATVPDPPKRINKVILTKQYLSSLPM